MVRMIYYAGILMSLSFIHFTIAGVGVQATLDSDCGDGYCDYPTETEENCIFDCIKMPGEGLK